jgi:hypothetical protein
MQRSEDAECLPWISGQTARRRWLCSGSDGGVEDAAAAPSSTKSSSRVAAASSLAAVAAVDRASARSRSRRLAADDRFDGGIGARNPIDAVHLRYRDTIRARSSASRADSEQLVLLRAWRAQQKSTAGAWAGKQGTAPRTESCTWSRAGVESRMRRGGAGGAKPTPGMAEAARSGPGRRVLLERRRCESPRADRNGKFRVQSTVDNQIKSNMNNMSVKIPSSD